MYTVQQLTLCLGAVGLGVEGRGVLGALGARGGRGREDLVGGGLRSGLGDEGLGKRRVIGQGWLGGVDLGVLSGVGLGGGLVLGGRGAGGGGGHSLDLQWR